MSKKYKNKYTKYKISVLKNIFGAKIFLIMYKTFISKLIKNNRCSYEQKILWKYGNLDTNEFRFKCCLINIMESLWFQRKMWKW